MVSFPFYQPTFSQQRFRETTDSKSLLSATKAEIKISDTMKGVICRVAL